MMFQAYLLLFVCLGAFAIPTLRADSVIHDKDRIAFCGDSITGQGAKAGPDGWVGLIEEGLAIAHPSGGQTLTALGGSGSTVQAWLNFEKRSRDEAVFLDIPDVDIKTTLDGGADVLIFMLGMNDLLAPSIKDSPADFDAWASRYHDLIEACKARAHPRVIALATITPCTEDLNSPKNRVEAQLNIRLAALAKEEGAIVLPTHEAMVELLEKGRNSRFDFHVTRDFVHPAPVGHLAIAVGMLRGLGENDAAQQLLDKHLAHFMPPATDLPTLSYTLRSLTDSADEARQHLTIHYQWTSPATSTEVPVVTPTVPDGWEITPANQTGESGDFDVVGPLDHLMNMVRLDAATSTLRRQIEIGIPAGWRIAVGGGNALGWTKNTIYDPVQDQEPLDQELNQDSTWLLPIPFPFGQAAARPWQCYIASIDFTGKGIPDSVDMAAVTFFKYHDLAYGARWIYSDKNRLVQIMTNTQAFAGTFGLKVWLNEDLLCNDPGKKVTVEGHLRHGWNRLWFKSSFIQWQWEFSIDVAGEDGDDLDDLRFSMAPPPGTVPATTTSLNQPESVANQR